MPCEPPARLRKLVVRQLGCTYNNNLIPLLAVMLDFAVVRAHLRNDAESVMGEEPTLKRQL
jgi:hypothetical protein